MMSAKKRKLFFLILLTTLMGLPAFGGDYSDHVQDKLLLQGLAPFPSTSPSVPEIREVHRFEALGYWLRDFFVARPTLKDARERQLQAIALLRELRDPRSFETLLEASRFSPRGFQHVQFEARDALIQLMSQWDDEHRQKIVQSFEEDRREIEKFHQMENGALGEFGKVAVAQIDSTILSAKQKLEELPADSQPLNGVQTAALQYKKAAFGGGLTLIEMIAAPLRAVVQNPLTAPTQLATGIVLSAVDALIKSPATFAGLVTGGRVGLAGEDLGRSATNIALWTVPALKGVEAVRDHLRDRSRRAVQSKTAAEMESPDDPVGERLISAGRISAIEWARLEPVEKRLLLSPFEAEGIAVDPLELYLDPPKAASVIKQILQRAALRDAKGDPIKAKSLLTDRSSLRNVWYWISHDPTQSIRVILTNQPITIREFNSISYKPNTGILGYAKDGAYGDGQWNSTFEFLAHDISHFSTSKADRIVSKSGNGIDRLNKAPFADPATIEMRMNLRKGYWERLLARVERHPSPLVREAFHAFWFFVTHEGGNINVWNPRKILNAKLNPKVTPGSLGSDWTAANRFSRFTTQFLDPEFMCENADDYYQDPISQIRNQHIYEAFELMKEHAREEPRTRFQDEGE